MSRRKVMIQVPTSVTVDDLLYEISDFTQSDHALIDLALGLLSMADDDENTRRNARVAKWLGVKLPARKP